MMMMMKVMNRLQLTRLTDIKIAQSSVLNNSTSFELDQAN